MLQKHFQIQCDILIKNTKYTIYIYTTIQKSPLTVIVAIRLLARQTHLHDERGREKEVDKHS